MSLSTPLAALFKQSTERRSHILLAAGGISTSWMLAAALAYVPAQPASQLPQQASAWQASPSALPGTVGRTAAETHALHQQGGALVSPLAQNVMASVCATADQHCRRDGRTLVSVLASHIPAARGGFVSN